MSERRDEKWFDDRLRQAINGTTPAFDAQAWQQKYAREYQTLIARGNRMVGWGLPHRFLVSRRLWWGKPHPTVRILFGSFGKVAIAAVILIATGILLIGRFGTTQPAPDLQPLAQPSPAQMVSMIALSAAFNSGGMEGLNKQCDRALERLGPRPTSVSVQQLLKDISDKG